LTIGVCRVCRCTDEAACCVRNGERLTGAELQALHAAGVDLATVGAPCTWIEPDLCSACVTPAPPLLFDAYGAPLRGAP
jgi:hypothetical protein